MLQITFYPVYLILQTYLYVLYVFYELGFGLDPDPFKNFRIRIRQNEVDFPNSRLLTQKE